MNRKKQIMIFVVVIPILLFLFLRLGEYRLTDEGMFYAVERGLRYGPSEEILTEVPLSKGGKMMVGKWEDSLSVISVERAWGALWKMKGGYGHISGEKYDPWNEHLNRNEDIFGIQIDEWFLGLSTIDEVTEVFYIFSNPGGEEDEFVMEGTVSVDEKGFFIEKPELLMTEDPLPYLSYIEGRNAQGEVLYRHGDDKTGDYYLDNELYTGEGD